MSRKLLLIGLIVGLFGPLTNSSQLHAQHPPIFLLDSEGNEINPMTGENADQPVSTAMTCGTCHEYDEITSGYHFQMGWDVVSDEFGEKEGRPWETSDGMMGKWCPMYLRQLAKKENKSADEIDLTVFEFIASATSSGSYYSCGSCHPGGGGLEYDRDGNRYDEHLAENPELKEEFDGDYYQSNWDKSGVVEADCFICHMDGYNFDSRSEQLSYENFKWAIIAGSGLGIVDGEVSSGDEPTVTYNRRLFNEDGSITFDMSWPPPDDNCLFCHGQGDVRKRGFSWNDIHNPDIHNAQGISCTACHPSSLDHRFAKGNASDLRVADSLDGTMRNCKGCHEQGYLGATIPQHTKIRPSHLESISCEACHIPSLNRSAALGFEASSGTQVFTTNPPDADGLGELGEWRPIYERWEGRKIYPFNSMVLVWWGNYEADSIVYPLWLREHGEGWQLFEDEVTDDNGDGKKEVNRDEEIIAGLKAFAQSLQGNQRFSRIHPVLVKAGKAYHLDENGQLALLPYETAPCTKFSISHNVAPAHQALGAKGCDDCHAPGAYFFKGGRVIDLADASGEMLTQPIGESFGCNPIAFSINAFHQDFLSPIVSIALIMVIFAITLHYHSYGPKHIAFVPDSGEVLRFTFFERAIHLSRLLTFVILSITGLIMAFNWVEWQDLLFSSPRQMLLIHIWSGVVFIFSTVGGMFVWFKDALFASYDRVWVKKLGGYLGYKGEVPSGRFNAGQKMFYWYSTIMSLLVALSGIMLTIKYWFELSTICITSTVHNLVAFILLAGVLSHAYLGTVANPGTWRVLVDGFVTRVWAEHHHPNWYRSLIRKGKIEPELHDETEDDDE